MLHIFKLFLLIERNLACLFDIREDDWADVVRIEQDNFSPEEAATPEAIAERLKTICDTFTAEIKMVVWLH